MTGSCIDLRKQYKDREVMSLFSQLVSGKKDYQIVEQIEKKFCTGCKLELKPVDKFCSNCGTKAV